MGDVSPAQPEGEANGNCSPGRGSHESEVSMATQSISTLQQLNSPPVVPIFRRPLTRPTVRLKELRKEKQIQERQKLIVELLPLVKHVAFKIRQHLPDHVEVEDLTADGVLGLLDAIRKFDDTKRVKLEIYARHRLRGAILDGLRGVDPVPRGLTAE